MDSIKLFICFLFLSGCFLCTKKHTYKTTYNNYTIKGEYMDQYRHDTIADIDSNVRQVYKIHISKIRCGTWSYFDSVGNLCAVKVYDAEGRESRNEIYNPINNKILNWDEFDTSYVVIW